MSKTAPTPTANPRLAQALDAAERRLVMLERLADMAMAVATAISEAVVEFPRRAGSGPQGARGFAQAARAVRLTLMLAARVETSILAMRKGELGLEAGPDARAAADPVATRAERVRAAVAPALEREASDAEDAEMLRRRLNARLCEGEDVGDFLSRPFEECVTAICADMGIDPGPILTMEAEGGPSPPAGEGGPRSGSDEGPTRTIRGGVDSPGGDGSSAPHPSAAPTPSPARGEGSLANREEARPDPP